MRLHSRVDLGLRHARHPERRGDILINGEVRVVDELLVDHRDIALLHRHGADILAAEEHLAGGWPLETGHQLHQCRLAGERRAEEHVEGALGEGRDWCRGCECRRRPA